MAGPFLVVRLPLDGTLVGQTVAQHPGARLSCVGAGLHEHDQRQVADHVALVEGVPDVAVAGMLLAWRTRYGESPQVLGGPFALRLPVDLAGDRTGVEAACLRLGASLPDPRQVVTADGLEIWSPYGSEDAAQLALAGLRPLMAGMPILWSGTAQARRDDLEAWSVLREAAVSLVPDCLAAT
jgi:hypothetical protein